MKHLLWLGFIALSLLLCLSQTSNAQTTRFKVVIEVTSNDAKAWNNALNHVENLRNALGKDQIQIEVVCHGPGLELLKNTHPGPDTDRMRAFSQDKVVFAACENTMKKQKVTKMDLWPFATPVDSGVSELVRKQTQGWSYIHEK